MDLKLTARLTAAFKKLGFKYVTLDLEGFRSGAMNAGPKVKQNYKKGQLEKV